MSVAPSPGDRAAPAAPGDRAAPAAPGTGLIASLVGIRGVLAAMVLLVHLSAWANALAPAGGPLWTYFGGHLYWALDFFFILSGFVVTTGYRSRFARWPGRAVYGRFLWARLSRFYPVHLTVLAALVAVVLVSRAAGAEIAHGGDLGVDLARHLLLLQGWGGAHGLTWNGPSWSVSAEWLCYLAMPLVVPLLVRLRSPGVVLLGYATSMAVLLGAYGVLGYDDPHITYVAPLWRAGSEFVAGALLCQLREVGPGLPTWLGRRTGAVVVALAVTAAALSLAHASMLGTAPVAGVLVIALAEQRGLVNRVLATRGLLVAGELSVSLYLTHVPWLMASALVITPARFPGAWGWLGVGLIVVGAVVVAVVTHRVVEVPAQRFMAGLVRRPAGSARPSGRGAADRL